MVNQRRYKRGKKTNRRKTRRVKRSKVKRSRFKRSRVKRTKMRGGMEGTSDTTGQVPGDTEVPFLQYDFDKTYNSKNYKTWMKNIIKSEGAKRDKYNKFIKEYEERCKKEYLRDSEQFLKMKSLGMTTEEYLENTQKAGELQISLEEYLDLKQKAEKTRMTVEDFLELKRKL
jgi:phage anti-repressor protein